MNESPHSAIREAIRPDKLLSVYSALARHYDLQHGLSTLGADQRGRRLVVEHAVRSGDNVLDAGGGTGSTALLAARKAGPAGHVTVLDFCADMLDVARERADRAGLTQTMSFRTGDMLDLPFPDASFDTVLSTYSVCPLFDPVAGALELYRVLKPGGRLGVAHSASPQNPVMHWLAERFEDLVWLMPRLSMGCRAVSVLPDLQKAGAQVIYRRRLGIPLYPFLVFVAEKPASASKTG